ncbi:MAG: hypothetical protein J6D08_08165 [Lachnospiraceae bacterium]|nr:hypothetical protein [Lachnospiraceae bacterium]
MQEIAEEVKRELREQSIAYQDIEQEIMIETPAAAVMSDELSVAPAKVLALRERICSILSMQTVTLPCNGYQIPLDFCLQLWYNVVVIMGIIRLQSYKLRKYDAEQKRRRLGQWGHRQRQNQKSIQAESA